MENAFRIQKVCRRNLALVEGKIPLVHILSSLCESDCLGRGFILKRDQIIAPASQAEREEYLRGKTVCRQWLQAASVCVEPSKTGKMPERKEVENMKKRWLSMVLILCLILGLAPVSAGYVPCGGKDIRGDR